jgi:hypothetical protein
MGRLGEKHWNNLPWDSDLGRDDRLKDLISEEIVGDSQMVLDDLDDLCVLLLFSVFEAIKPAAVNPATAYDRLKRFLDHLGA